VAFRADIDALPIAERSDAGHRPAREGFASANPGVMHACGHDGHIAMGLALARLIHQNRADWPGRAVILFQPAEEGGRGARAMAAAGVVDGCDVMLTWHLGGRRNITGFIVGGASGFAISRKFRAVFTGRAAHAGSEPQNGRNALLGAATAALNLHALSRSSLGDTRVNVGRLVAGDAANIVAERAEMLFEVRSDKTAVLDDLDARAMRILEGAAQMHELELEIERFSETPSAASDARVIDCLAEVAAALPGVAGFHDRFQDPGSDDATILMQRVQERGGVATYALIGTRMPSGHHTPGFDFDEAAIMIGVRVLAAAAYRLASSDQSISGSSG
jgi:aminobenzoyl-glutamate utilization protein A